MTLELDSEVVYAILAAIVLIVLIVNTTRIVRLRYAPKYSPKPLPYDQETAQTQTWPQNPNP